jgi:TolB-like protein/class 3 adenylate cyclase/Tfp pilus assembly protein PilF
MASTRRRLAAILAADVVGYSRMMRADEEGTHERCKAHRRELIDPKISEHHGRIVKYTGDGMLVEFSSVVEAVLCAVEVQCGMNLRNVGIADDERIRFRIGVNLGDVIAEPEDIYGDGVNIAARLEALAEPNGICFSQTVYEQVRDKLPYPFEDLGQLSVKNIARPVHAFALRAETIAAMPLGETPSAQPLSNASTAGSMATFVPRLSIVVLPFANLSGDTAQLYLADAVTDDLTTDLSRIPDLVVISRNTAFTYRDRPIDTRQIGRELNVRYLLQGSVRRSGKQIRVNAQLIDAESDAHLWAERFDYATDDLFVLQDEVIGRIAVQLNLEVIRAEAARPADHPDAFDHILHGRAALNRGLTPENYSEAARFFEMALSLDSGSITARAFLAQVLAGRVLELMTSSFAEDTKLAERLIEGVLAASPRHAFAHYVRGQVLRAQNRFDEAIAEYETALALDRNSVNALAGLGQCKFFTGALDEVIPAHEQAIRLSPRDPSLPNWYWRIGRVHLLQSRLDDAISWIEKARNANPWLAGPHGWLASAYALKGDQTRAAIELSEARRLSGDGRFVSIARFKSLQSYGSAKTQALAEETFFAGLRKAGVPDE